MKRSRTLAVMAILILLALPLSACSLAGSSAVYASVGHLSGTQKVDSLDPGLQDGTLSFALSLYNRIGKDSDGFFTSPASILLALAMTRNGAAGQTATEMDTVFGATGRTLDELDAYARDLQHLITGRTPSSFELANSLWIRDTFKDQVVPTFLQRNKDYFGAAVEALDFNSPSAAQTINTWVSNNTHGRIKTIVDPPIDPAAVMFLIDTIYFKADWQTPFKKESTEDATFHAPSGDVTVRMMSSIDDFGYFENADLQAVRLPYADGLTSMVVLLPKAGHEASIDTLSVETWKTVLAGVTAGPTEIALRMPRTQFEFKASLKNVLSDLGMPTAFTDKADFTGISSDGGLMIGDVVHKTFLAIDEKGTEAAAATSVGIVGTAMPVEPDIHMTVDHPFVVAIVDDSTGLPIFLGRITEP